MMKLHRLIEHALSFSSQHLWAFVLLSVCAILQTSNVVLFDSLAGGLYLSRFGYQDLSFNFFVSALMLITSGLIVLRQNKLIGKGFLVFLSLAFVCQIGLMFAILNQVYLSYDVFFVLKWAYRAVLFGGFWNYAFRFVELNLKSKRFLFLIFCEMLGFLGSGLFVYSMARVLDISAFFMLLIASTFLLMLLLLKVSAFEKVTPELQLKKKGGINERTQVMLVYLIYTTAFFFSAIFAFIDYTVYLAIIEKSGRNLSVAFRSFGLIWALVGGFSLFFLATLYSLRRSFHITTALIMLSFLPLTSVLGYFSQIFWIVIFSKVCFELILYYGIGYYFRMLSRPLSYAEEARLKQGMFLMAVPAGFAFSSLVFYFICYEKSALILACFLSIAFLFALIDDQTEYAKALLRAFKTYRWRGGRLIITNPSVLKYITQRAESLTPAVAIYYLRVLEEAQVSNLKSHLRHALTHPSPVVRCFALESIERHDMRMFKKTLSDIMDKDGDNNVRQKALEVFCALGEKYGVEKAILYLDDPRFQKGAIIGLLKEGGEGILIASDGLNKLVHSKNPQQRLQAAEILTQAPRKGFFRLVLTLMNDKEVAVQKQAILAAGLIKHPLLLDKLFLKLEDPNVREEVLTALATQGSVAYNKIKQVLNESTYSELCQKTLLRFLWVSEDLQARYILLSVFKKLPVHLRFYAMKFFKQKTLYLTARQKKRTFIPLIDMDFKQALTTLLLIQDLRTSDVSNEKTYFDLLINSLYDDFERIRECLLFELNFLYPSSLMNKAVQVLLSPKMNEEEKKVAQATLDDLLPKKYRMLSLITKDASLAMRLDQLPIRATKNKTSFDQQFSYILKSKSYKSLWSKLCTLTCVRRLNNVSLTADVSLLLADKNPLIRQQSLWVLDGLVSDKKKRKILFAPLTHDTNETVRDFALSLLK